MDLIYQIQQKSFFSEIVPKVKIAKLKNEEEEQKKEKKRRTRNSILKIKAILLNDKEAQYQYEANDDYFYQLLEKRKKVYCKHLTDFRTPHNDTTFKFKTTGYTPFVDKYDSVVISDNLYNKLCEFSVQILPTNNGMCINVQKIKLL